MTTKMKHLHCAQCTIPYAQLVRQEDGTVAMIVVARHFHSEKHENLLTLAQIQQMFREFEEQIARQQRT